MLTALAATLLTIATVSPVPAAASATAGAPGTYSKTGTSVLATVLPTPGAWALMGMGGLALIRSRRMKR